MGINSSLEEFEEKIISGEIGLESVGSFEYEDDFEKAKA